MRLSTLARSVAARLSTHRCALPSCERRGIKLRCCGKRLCSNCLSRIMRASPCCKRLSLYCPFCRTRWHLPKRAVQRLMARACPDTHARTIECEVGPPCVAMHVPCPKGHYDCAFSEVRIFQLGPSPDKLHAQKRVLQHRLDDALRELASARGADERF